jgi:disulfide bond formation protein DsbB
MNFVALTQSMATLALGGAVMGIVLLTACAIPRARTRVVEGCRGGVRALAAAAFAVALVATGGSLYYSEVVGFVPCSLCWYQRIAMYPIVAILGLSLFRRDSVAAAPYALLLAGVGLVIALYHVTIQFLPSLDVGVCAAGVSCTGRYLAVFGFVSIPVMAASAFALIVALLTTLLFVNAASTPAPEES